MSITGGTSVLVFWAADQPGDASRTPNPTTDDNPDLRRCDTMANLLSSSAPAKVAQ
jgi:hypothetical protein